MLSWRLQYTQLEREPTPSATIAIEAASPALAKLSMIGGVERAHCATGHVVDPRLKSIHVVDL